MIDRIQIFDELQELVNEPFSDISDLLGTSEFKNTILVLLDLTGRIDFISESIIKLSVDNNVYSMRILFRSLIEHHLKHMYIFMKWARSKSDECAKEFLSYYAYYEELELGSSYKRQGKIMGSKASVSLIDALKELHPKVDSLNEVEIREKASQFFYKRIIEFLSDQLNKGKKDRFDGFLMSILPEYSEMSSFVHGGPFAVLVMSEFIDYAKMEEDTDRIADLTLSLSATTKTFSLSMLAHIDNKYVPVLHSYQSLLAKHKVMRSGA